MALDAVRARGTYVIVVTGRMFQAVRPYLTGPEPVVCYQGAVIADPTTGEFLQHIPIPLELAREAITAIQEAGYGLNCYVDDELYVAEITPEAARYASFQQIELHVVGPLLDWLRKPPTKLVVVGDPEQLDELGARMRAHFGGRLFIAKSLPFFLEVAQPGVSKGSALRWVCRRLDIDPAGVVAFGDGANDIELLEEAGFGVAVDTADAALLAHARATVPPPEQDGVAAFLEAVVSARS